VLGNRNSILEQKIILHSSIVERHIIGLGISLLSYQSRTTIKAILLSLLMSLYIGNSELMIKRMSNIEGHSAGDIIHSISDSKSLDLFCSIAKGSVESEVLKQTKGLTRKQYYTRTSQLLEQGLIQRNKGSFSLTCLGVVVHHAQSVIEKGVNNYWKLKAIDSIQSSAEIGEYERTKLIKTIIDDSGIESILVAQ
jgi:hypothetical protein